MKLIHLSAVVVWLVAALSAQQMASPLGLSVTPKKPQVVAESKLLPASAVIRSRVPLGVAKADPIACVFRGMPISVPN